MYSQHMVLFVDDEENILNSLRRGLIDEEYTCLFAKSGNEALDLLQKNKISVIVSDMRMPGMDGLALLKEVKVKYPSTVRIVLSGYNQLQQVLATINQVDVFKFITKPWKMEDEFKHVIKKAIDFYNMQHEHDELQKAIQNKNIAYQNILKRVDETIENARNSSEDIRQLGKCIFTYLFKMLDFEKSIPTIKSQVNKIWKMHDAFTHACIQEKKETSVSVVLKNIAEFIKSEYPGINTESDARVNQMAKVIVNEDIVKLLFISIIQILADPSTVSGIKLIFMEKEAVENEYVLSSSVTVTHDHMKVGLDKNAAKRNIDMLNEIFGPFIAYLGWQFKCSGSDTKYAAVLALKLKTAGKA